MILGTYYHGKLASPLTDLAGDGNKPMIDVNVQVDLNEKGNFSKAWAVDAKGIKTALPIVAPEKN